MNGVQKKKVLLVDDQPDIRRLIRLAVGNSYDLLDADTGSVALDLVRRERPDLVVLDIMMPGDLDGLDVLDRIRADAELAHTRVLMLTARGQMKDYNVAMERGADAYLIKPFSPMALADRIARLLRI